MINEGKEYDVSDVSKNTDQNTSSIIPQYIILSIWMKKECTFYGYLPTQHGARALIKSKTK